MHAHDPSRRRFIRGVAIGTAAVATGLSLTGCGGDDAAEVTFDHGVASGDPGAEGVVIWTRATPSREADVAIDWEIAADAGFTDVLASGTTVTGRARDYTVKIDVSGLLPGTRYYYRFGHRGRHSPVGRTRTLPVGRVEALRFAVFSCSNYPAGHFHVYAEAARRDDLDAAIHLGDYIYEYGVGGYASADAEAMGRVSEPAGELFTLEDYRRRYAQYRGDPDLQAIHAALPFILVWDDHEIANDTWAAGAENHDADEGAFPARRSAALRAYYEWLPVREPVDGRREAVYRSFEFGDLASLYMLDTRVIARDRQLDYAEFIDPATGTLDAAAFTAALSDPARELLGAEQMAWLQGRMAASTATWQLLGQQVLMGRMEIPAPLVTGQVGFADYSALLQKAATAPQSLTPDEQAVLAQPAIPYNLDAWDGYPVARENLLGTARALEKNLVVLAGDTHNAWASDLADIDGNPVGVEFATSSVSSPGLEEYFPEEDPDAVAAGLVRLIEPLAYADTEHRGYMTVTVTPASVESEWVFVDSVKRTDYRVLEERNQRLRVDAGRPRIVAAR